MTTSGSFLVAATRGRNSLSQHVQNAPSLPSSAENWRPFCSGRRSLALYDNVLCFICSPVVRCWSVTMYRLLQTDFVDTVRWSCSSSAIVPPKSYSFLLLLLLLHIYVFFSSVKLPAIMQAPLDRLSPNKRHLPVARWMEVSSSGQFLSSAWPHYLEPGFNVRRYYWALLNCLQANQGHCASCQKKWSLAATDMCPCGKCQTMSHIVDSCPQSMLEGAAAIALSGWRYYQMAEHIPLINALDNNNN